MIELEHISKRTNLGYKGCVLDKKFSFYADEYYKLNNSFILAISHDNGYNTYSVIDSFTTKTTLVLSTFDKGNYELINVVESSSINVFPAVKLYSFLIKKLKKILVTKEQSIGGIILWQKLSRVNGVSVYGWDFKKDKVYNTDKYLKDNDDLYVNRNIKKYHKDIADICLVAVSR